MALNNNSSLKKGSSGSQVKELQNALKTLGYYTRSVDGSFGYYTEQAVKSFQKAYSLTVDGWAGSKTCTKINEVLNSKTNNTSSSTALFNCNIINLKRGSKDTENVKKLQTALKSLKYYTREVDGDFGYYTEQALKNFQKDNGHTADGWLGAKTCKTLNQKYGVTNNIQKSAIRNPLQGKVNVDTNVENTTNAKLAYKVVTLPEQVNINTNEGMNSDSTTQSANTTLKAIEFNDILSPSDSQDLDGLSYDSSFKTPYTPEKLAGMQINQKIEFYWFKDGVLYRCNRGYITSLKIVNENHMWMIQVNMSGYTAFLNIQIEYEGTTTKSNHIRQICSKVGLKFKMDYSGLPDINYTMKKQESTTDSTESTGTGTIEGGMTRAEIFNIAKTWSYGGYSTTDPETAYNAYKNGTKSFDCYGASACLYYMFSKFTKIGVQVVQGYSPYAKSRTHRTIQLKENGSWIDPPEYKQMTKNLRVLTSYSRTTLQKNGVIYSTDNKVVTV